MKLRKRKSDCQLELSELMDRNRRRFPKASGLQEWMWGWKQELGQRDIFRSMMESEYNNYVTSARCDRSSGVSSRHRLCGFPQYLHFRRFHHTALQHCAPVLVSSLRSNLPGSTKHRDVLCIFISFKTVARGINVNAFTATLLPNEDSKERGERAWRG